MVFLLQTAYLISQIFFGTRWNYPQSQPIISGLFTGLLSLISLIMFFAWQKQFRYSLLALFFFWLSFAVKDIVWYVVEGKSVLLEISVTLFQMISSGSLIAGIFQGELKRLLHRKAAEVVSDSN